MPKVPIGDKITFDFSKSGVLETICSEFMSIFEVPGRMSVNHFWRMTRGKTMEGVFGRFPFKYLEAMLTEQPSTNLREFLQRRLFVTCNITSIHPGFLHHG